MNRYVRLMDQLKRREKVTGTTFSILAEPILLERMSDRLDFVLIDMEHGRFDISSAQPMLQICRMLKLPSLVRVRDSQYHLIAKAIDMGADGVMVPRVDTPEQLKTAIDAICFAPVGRKGVGGCGQFRTGENMEEFQHSRLLFPQIESPQGIQNLPKMLERYGERISAVMIGPNDLSVMLGTPLQLRSPEVEAAVREIFAISASYGKSCGIFCDDAMDAAHYRAMGANVLWTASDLQFYLRGFEETMAELQAL